MAKPFSVTYQQVKSIAENFMVPSCENKVSPFSGKYKSAQIKKIKEITTVLTSTNDTALFIVNYEEAGFVIVSGDKRLQPILAFSSTGSFPCDLNKCPAVTVDWLTFVKNNIIKLKESKISINPVTEANWGDMTTQQTGPIDPPPTTCTDEFLQYGSFLSTHWGQDNGFNKLLPTQQSLGCNNMPDSRAWVGCVPLAMAQMIRYHQRPDVYAWSVMPNTYSFINSGMDEIARMIRDIHKKVPVVYSCTSTGVNTVFDIGTCFRDSFNYYSAYDGTYGLAYVKNNLQLNLPVILAGGSESGDNRHSWVCDGYMYSKNCIYINGNYVGTSILEHLSMNWGCNGVADGWYSVDSFNPVLTNGINDFNFLKKMTINIIP